MRRKCKNVVGKQGKTKKASRKSKIMKYVKHASSSTDFNGKRQNKHTHTKTERYTDTRPENWGQKNTFIQPETKKNP